MAVLYWIHCKEHTSPNKDGYVGVTVNIKQRMYRHKTNKKNSHLSNSINKYGWDNLTIDILYSGPVKKCYVKEKEIRPKVQIGWNQAIGGVGGDRSKFINYKNVIHLGWSYDKSGTKNPFYGKKHSIESIDKMCKSRSNGNLIRTPEGLFYGFRAVSRHYSINKITAQRWVNKKQEWTYENV